MSESSTELAAYEAMRRGMAIDKEEREAERLADRAEREEFRQKYIVGFEPRMQSLEDRLDRFEAALSQITNAANAGEPKFDPSTLGNSGGIGNGPVPVRKPPHA